MSHRRRLLWVGALAALVLFAAFIALGTWQMQRRAWKLALIDRVSQRVDAAPVAAPGPADWAGIDRDSAEYRRIELRGHWQHEREALVQAATALGAGHWVMTPLTTTDGFTVLINRGFVDTAHRVPSARPSETAANALVHVVGLLRITEPDGGFLRDNDPAADRWFSRDVAAIAAARGLTQVAPYFVDAAASAVAATAPTPSAAAPAAGSKPATTSAPPAPAMPTRPASPATLRAGGDETISVAPTQWPVPGLTVIRFRNHHLAYALTWYTLALMVAAGAIYVIGRRRPSALTP